jgi:hypothetical protein
LIGQVRDCRERARRARQSRPDHSLSQRVKSIAVARNYILGLSHLLLKGRIVRHRLVSSVWRFDQEETLAAADPQTTDHLFGQDNAERS